MQAFSAQYVFDGEVLHRNKAVLVDNGLIVDIVDKKTIAMEILTDYKSGVITPGLIDLQLNGCGGVLFNEAIELDTLEIMADTCLVYGTTKFMPTLITCDFTDVLKALDVVKEWFMRHGDHNHSVLGLHLEGPFLSKEKKGIHPEEYIIKPQQELLERIVAYSKFFPIMMTIAVEKFDKEQLSYLSDNGIILSVGHSNASYTQATAGFSFGVKTTTHMYNAMSGLTGRNPGVIGAVLNNKECYASVIVDMLHVDVANINLLHNIKRDKMYLVTDAVTPTGTDMLEFMLAGKRLEVKDGKCVNELGVLGGACLTMNDAVRNCVEFCGIDLVSALKMATLTPAKVIGMDHVVGRIRTGYHAQLVHIDTNSDNYACSIIF